MGLIVYHGTRQPSLVMSEGLRIPEKHAHDPGDFGLGIYTTTIRERAASYGIVLACELNTDKYARIPNPYFLAGLEPVPPTTEAEAIFHALIIVGSDMLTINGSAQDRVLAAEVVRNGMLEAGYTGIVTECNGECVTYDPGTIRIRGVVTE